MYALPFNAFAYEPTISWYFCINFNSIVREQFDLIYTVLFSALVLFYVKVWYNSAEKYLCVSGINFMTTQYNVWKRLHFYINLSPHPVNFLFQLSVIFKKLHLFSQLSFLKRLGRLLSLLFKWTLLNVLINNLEMLV